MIYAEKHHTNQLWGMLKDWFINNDVVAGMHVLVRFDPNERHEGFPVIHLIAEEKPQRVTIGAR